MSAFQSGRLGCHSQLCHLTPKENMGDCGLASLTLTVSICKMGLMAKVPVKGSQKIRMDYAQRLLTTWQVLDLILRYQSL